MGASLDHPCAKALRGGQKQSSCFPRLCVFAVVPRAHEARYSARDCGESVGMGDEQAVAMMREAFENKVAAVSVSMDLGAVGRG